MPLELKIVSDNADLVGDDNIREFGDEGGTIGRSLQNDWILPDPDRYVSSRHATIDYKGGVYYLLDTSSNGVYVNDDVEPIGKGNPRRLFDGDRLRMGDFQIEVSVDSGESLVMPLDEKPSVAPDHIEQFVDEVSIRTGMQMLDEEEITGDDVFQSALFGGPAKPVVKERQVEVEHKILHDPKSPSLEVTAEDLFDSFLDGLGISRAELHPSVSRPDMMLTAGQVLRESVTGMTELLQNRANLKHTFRLDQTTVLPRHNNPMKLSDNTNDLLKQLLVGGEGDYLGARDSIREVCRDLNNHQAAFLDAMNSAFIEFADRFDPAELQEGFDRTLSSNKLLAFLNQGKYWRLYGDLYPIITEKGGGRFPQMFAEEFVRAYERQVAEYQRRDRDGTASKSSGDEIHQAVDPGLMETQSLNLPVVDESAFEDHEVVDALSKSGVVELDQSFLDDLENSMNDAIEQDQLKA